eukprot:12003456-Alexandrium_andersonii.AAC.1
MVTPEPMPRTRKAWAKWDEARARPRRSATRAPRTSSPRTSTSEPIPKKRRPVEMPVAVRRAVEKLAWP